MATVDGYQPAHSTHEHQTLFCVLSESFAVRQGYGISCGTRRGTGVEHVPARLEKARDVLVLALVAFAAYYVWTRYNI